MGRNTDVCMCVGGFRWEGGEGCFDIPKMFPEVATLDVLWHVDPFCQEKFEYTPSERF